MKVTSKNTYTLVALLLLTLAIHTEGFSQAQQPQTQTNGWNNYTSQPAPAQNAPANGYYQPQQQPATTQSNGSYYAPQGQAQQSNGYYQQQPLQQPATTQQSNNSYYKPQQPKATQQSNNSYYKPQQPATTQQQPNNYYNNKPQQTRATQPSNNSYYKPQQPATTQSNNSYYKPKTTPKATNNKPASPSKYYNQQQNNRTYNKNPNTPPRRTTTNTGTQNRPANNSYYQPKTTPKTTTQNRNNNYRPTTTQAPKSQQQPYYKSNRPTNTRPNNQSTTQQTNNRYNPAKSQPNTTQRPAAPRQQAQPVAAAAPDTFKIRLKAAPKVKVSDVSDYMSRGRQAGMRVIIPQGDAKIVAKNWKKYLKTFDAKVKKKSGEYIGRAALAPSISATPIDIYTLIETFADGVSLTSFFDAGDVFLSVSEKGRYEAARALLTDFAIAESVESMTEELAKAEIDLLQLEGEREVMRADEETLQYQIEEYKEALKRAEIALKQNRGLQIQTDQSTKVQIKKVEQMKHNLQSIASQR